MDSKKTNVVILWQISLRYKTQKSQIGHKKDHRQYLQNNNKTEFWPILIFCVTFMVSVTLNLSSCYSLLEHGCIFRLVFWHRAILRKVTVLPWWKCFLSFIMLAWLNISLHPLCVLGFINVFTCRWLICVGRNDEAFKIVKRYTKHRPTKLTEEMWQTILETEHKKVRRG